MGPEEVEWLATEIYGAVERALDDQVGEVTAEDFHDLLIESQREDYRDMARRIIARMNDRLRGVCS